MNYQKAKEMVANGDPVKVAEDFGIQIFPRGGRNWILCPSHLKMVGKNDRKPNNCYLTQHGYHCYACGKTGNFIEMVADFLGLPFESSQEKNEAAKLVAETSYPEFLEESEEESQKKAENTLEPLPFSYEELKKIGLQDTMIKRYTGMSYTEKPADIPFYMDCIFEDGVYQLIEKKPFTLRMFYNQNKVGFTEMVKGKAMETYASMRNLIESNRLNNANPIYKNEIIQYANERLRAATHILFKMGYIEKKPLKRKIQFDFSRVMI